MSKRILFLDILRICAGIFVVAIHVSDSFINYPFLLGGLTWWIANIINSFSRISVPLFVMISGALLLPINKNISGISFYKKRFTRIIIPFVFFTILYIAWSNIWLKNPISLSMIVHKYVSGSLGHLYFLIVIAGLYLITPFLSIFIRNATENEKRKTVFGFFIFSSMLLLFSRIFPEAAFKPNSLTMFIPYIPFFLAGHYFTNVKVISTNIRTLFTVFIVLGILNAVLNFIFFNVRFISVSGITTIQTSSFVYEAYNPIIILMTVIFFIILKSFYKGSKTAPIFVKTLSSLVFGVYLIHPIVIDILNRAFHFNIESLLSPLWFFMSIKFIITIVISFAAVFFLKKIPVLKVIFG